MRRFIIDTDTASDDAVALIMALKNEDIRIEAITTVNGNVDVKKATDNAIVCLETADVYYPPVYVGASRSFVKDPVYADYVHGKDGLGNSGLKPQRIFPERETAVQKIIDIIMSNEGEIELVALGPLTNIAMAYICCPDIAKKVKNVVIMGGCGFSVGNVTPVAEFNIYVDAEAADIVMRSGMPITLVGFEHSIDKSSIMRDEIEELSKMGRIGEFIKNITSALHEFDLKTYGRDGIDLPDAVAMAVAFDDTIGEYIKVDARVEYRGEYSYGQIVMDRRCKESNIKLCTSFDSDRFKKMLLYLISK